MEKKGPLAGRVALVTGMSRQIGIGFAIASRLIDDGATVFGTGWPAHDQEMPWGADPWDGDPFDPERFHWVEADLSRPDVPPAIIEAVVERFGTIDIVVANHARSSHEPLASVTAEELDRCWAVNARASVLLAQALGANRPARPGGRLVLFTSGQHLGPMGGELAYAVSKGAIHQMTWSISDQLADAGISVNCINPGPVDTGYATGERHQQVAAGFPAGRWGQPADVARLVAWLVSDEAAWITGQVIDSTGGWRGPSS